MKLKCVDGGSGVVGYSFWCPGCNESHVFYTQNPKGPAWAFNGDTERPTFTPSLLLTCGHFMSSHKDGEPCWCTFNADRVAKGEEPAPFECGRCHLILTDGRLQFCGDSTHHLANQTVDLPDLPEEPSCPGT